MYQSYDSDTSQLVIVCTECRSENKISVKDLSLSVGSMEKGLFIRFPKCSCGAVCTVFTGFKVKVLRCHCNCSIAKAAFKVGFFVSPDESKTEKEIKVAVKERLDELESTYENGSVEHQQFLGGVPFVFPVIKAD